MVRREWLNQTIKLLLPSIKPSFLSIALKWDHTAPSPQSISTQSFQAAMEKSCEAVVSLKWHELIFKIALSCHPYFQMFFYQVSDFHLSGLSNSSLLSHDWVSSSCIIPDQHLTRLLLTVSKTFFFWSFTSFFASHAPRSVLADVQPIGIFSYPMGMKDDCSLHLSIFSWFGNLWCPWLSISSSGETEINPIFLPRLYFPGSCSLLLFFSVLFPSS